MQFKGQPPEGRFLAAGTIEFEPGVLKSADTLRLVFEPGAREHALAVVDVLRWPDGSVMSAELQFLADGDTARAGRFWIEWGSTRRAIEPRNPQAEQLSRVAFALVPEGNDGRTVLDVPAGQIIVRLDRHPELYYYWYLIPIVGILALLIYRKVHLR